MKFSIDKHILIDPLKQVASALPSKAIIPILSGILFVVNEQGLSMTAGNSHVYIGAVIDPDDFECIKNGAIVLPGKQVEEIVQKSGEILTFEAKGMKTTIKSGTNNFNLTGNEPDEYPIIPTVEADIVSVSGESFKKLVRKTVFATADEKSATPILTGVNFEFSEGKVRATATNRNRMARTELPIESDATFSTVISSDNLNILMKIAHDGNIDFQFGYDGFIAKMKGVTFYSRVLEGTYPDLDRILKHTFMTTAIFKTKDMINALENVEIIAREEKVRKAKVTISDDMLIESNTSGGDAAVSVELSEVNGEGIIVSFNVRLVLDALKALDSDQAIINFTGKLEPIVFTGAEDPNSTYIVLPYLVS